jgi:hypothetical protein
MLWSAHRNPARHLVPRERLKERYKESRGGAPDGPVRKNQTATDYHTGPTDKRASLRGEYENFLIPQTPSDVISTYPLAPQKGVSGGDENASTYYVPSAQRRSPPASEGSERANVLALRVGIFQYNNVLVPTVRRVARMRRHLTSIHITY